LIIFLAQNTRSTEVTFLWMTASTPLAVALLIAAVGSVLLTLIIGTARIAQLRHLIRKNATDHMSSRSRWSTPSTTSQSPHAEPPN
jgi:uncharacterized integral membrane protein